MRLFLLLSLAVAAVGARWMDSHPFLRYLAARQYFLSEKAPIKQKPLITLPGLDFAMNSKQFSGYLQASPTRHLHYYFTYPEDDYARFPLIVWLMGGPGCSPLVGAFTGIGPFYVDKDGKTLKENANSWNRIANLLFINAPVGTGYSYATNGNLDNTDKQVAEENYAALKDFFNEFPQFKRNELYLMGQSYAAIFLTMLAEKIVLDQEVHGWNLQGVAVGNGLFAWDLFWSTTPIKAYNTRIRYVDRLLSEDKFRKFEKECCDGNADNGCDVSKSEEKFKCAKNATMELFGGFMKNGQNRYNVDDSCEEIEKSRDFGPVYPCIDHSAVYKYLNQDSVREALGVPKNLPKWDVCNLQVRQGYKTSARADMGPRVRYLVDSGVRYLLYYGERDLQTNDLIGEEFSRRVGLKRLGKDEYVLYYDSRVKGRWTSYISENATNFKEPQRLDFVTIEHAGFFVANEEPEMTMRLIEAFTNKKNPYVRLDIYKDYRYPKL